MSTLDIQLLYRRSIDFPELGIFASRTGTMINLHWLELPMARTIFHGPKGVRAIEVRLYVYSRKAQFAFCSNKHLFCTVAYIRCIISNTLMVKFDFER